MYEETEAVRENQQAQSELLEQLAALGINGPSAMSWMASGGGRRPEELSGDAWVLQLLDVVAAADCPELVGHYKIELSQGDLPWKKTGLQLRDDQEVTFLLGGRWWLSRELDVWVEPGVAFHARIDGEETLFNPMQNSGLMPVMTSGELEIARSIGEWQSAAGDLFTPEEVYQQFEGEIHGLALVWQAGKAEAGLRQLLAKGDASGVLMAELSRMLQQVTPPPGWKNFFMFGNGDMFHRCGDDICCHTHKNVGILQRDLELSLQPHTRLQWRWIVDALPSKIAEDQALTHDYLSIAVEFDDGRDLTYMWSVDMPVGHVFECPLPRWAGIETHVVVRSGYEELGQWLEESRDVYADYHQFIGGEATQVRRVWLIANSVFQRGVGECRFADIIMQDSQHRQYRLDD